jgi:hypothetical protein
MYNLQFDCFAFQLDGTNFLGMLALASCGEYKVYSDSGDVGFSVRVIGESKEKTGFSDSTVSYEKKSKQS